MESELRTTLSGQNVILSQHKESRLRQGTASWYDGRKRQDTMMRGSASGCMHLPTRPWSMFRGHAV